MDRKNFIKKAALGTAAALTGSSLVKANSRPEKSTYDKLMEQVGFNHLPNKEIKSYENH